MLWKNQQLGVGGGQERERQGDSLCTGILTKSAPGRSSDHRSVVQTGNKLQKEKSPETISYHTIYFCRFWLFANFLTLKIRVDISKKFSFSPIISLFTSNMLTLLLKPILTKTFRQILLQISFSLNKLTQSIRQKWNIRQSRETNISWRKSQIKEVKENEDFCNVFSTCFLTVLPISV